MGNKTSKNLTATNTYSIGGNDGNGIGQETESNNVKRFKKLARINSVVMKDPVHGFEKFVPLLADIDNSSILIRRREKSERLSSNSTCEGSSTKFGKGNSKRSKKMIRSISYMESCYQPNIYTIDEVTSPSVYNEMRDALSANSNQCFKF